MRFAHFSALSIRSIQILLMRPRPVDQAFNLQRVRISRQSNGAAPMYAVMAERTDQDDILKRVSPAVAAIDDVVVVRLSLEIECDHVAVADAAGRAVSRIDRQHDLSADALCLRSLPRFCPSAWLRLWDHHACAAVNASTSSSVLTIWNTHPA